jgi:hypothetical protein
MLTLLEQIEEGKMVHNKLKKMHTKPTVTHIKCCPV